MTLNKKNLFFGVVLGALGISFYNSSKNYKKTISDQHINFDNSYGSSTRDYIDELKNQANILKEKLNEFNN
jgi:hypothetical protein